MKFLGSKQIETPRLLLRNTEREDLHALWSIRMLPKVNAYFLSKPNSDWSKEQSVELKRLKDSQNPDVYRWSIVLKKSNKCIGEIALPEVPCEDLKNREIWWYISPDYQNKGIMYEAAEAIFDYMFKEVEINMIKTYSAIQNENNNHLLEKLGFKKENESKIMKTNNGKLDFIQYSLKKEKWLNRNKDLVTPSTKG